MGCFAFIVMFILMIVGTIQWNEGGLWIPAICWTLAAIAGAFSAALFSYPGKPPDEANDPPLD